MFNCKHTMLSAPSLLCKFAGMLKDFPGSERLGVGIRFPVYHCIGFLGREVIAIKILAGCVG